MDENIVSSRIGAFFMDGVLWGLVFMLFSLASGQADLTNGIYFYLSDLPLLIYIVLATTYHIFMEATYGGTIGKLALRIIVVNETGDKITLKQSFIRNMMRFVDGFPYIVPYLVGLVAVATSPTKQRLGDRLARTYVVRPE